jgi:hypothetical protein
MQTVKRALSWMSILAMAAMMTACRANLGNFFDLY